MKLIQRLKQDHLKALLKAEATAPATFVPPPLAEELLLKSFISGPSIFKAVASKHSPPAVKTTNTLENAILDEIGASLATKVDHDIAYGMDYSKEFGGGSFTTAIKPPSAPVEGVTLEFAPAKGGTITGVATIKLLSVEKMAYSNEYTVAVEVTQGIEKGAKKILKIGDCLSFAVKYEVT